MSATAFLEGLDPTQDPRSFLQNAHGIVDAAQKKQLPNTLRPLKQDWNILTNGLIRLHPSDIVASGPQWSGIMRFLADTLSTATNNPQTGGPALATLATALFRLDPTSGTLTSHHLALVRASLTVKAYAEAKPVLDKNIHSFPVDEAEDTSLSNAYITVKSGVTEKLQTKEIQEYFLSGAMIYIALKEWSRAQAFLEHVLCTPNAGNPSAYQLEAYKKWMLVGLLTTGKMPQAPKATSQSAIKALRSLSKEYEAVCEAFKSKDAKKLRAEIYEAEKEFRKAANYGLVLEVLLHYSLSIVTRLSQTFATVPISTVAQKLRVSTEEAAKYVRDLVQDGAFKGSVDQGKQGATIRFETEAVQSPTEADEKQLQQSVVSRTAKLQELADHVNEQDRRLSLTAEYAGVIKSRRATAADKLAKAQMNPAAVVEDEEAMEVSFQEHLTDDDDDMTTAEAR